MKVSLPAKNEGSKSAPLLPLLPSEEDKLDASNSKIFTLLTDPANNDSAKYKTSCRVLEGTESVRAVIQWRKAVSEVVIGLNATTAATQFRICSAVLKGMALTNFQHAMTDRATGAYNTAHAAAVQSDANRDDGLHTDRDAVVAHGTNHYRTVDMIKESLQYVVQQAMPSKTLQRVKRYLRRSCRKPADMKVRVYFQRLLTIANDEITYVPPFDPEQILSEDELIDILLFGTPKSWQNEMDRQGFDPIANCAADVVAFMEQIETAEEFNGNAEPVKGNKHAAKKKKSSGTATDKGDKNCLLHGNAGHTTDECKVLKAEADKLKKTNTNKTGGNKTWSRKAEEAKVGSKKELAAFINKSIKQGVQKELASVEKKRKATAEMNAFDLDDDALKDFNYADLDDLRIDSSDEVSI